MSDQFSWETREEFGWEDVEKKRPGRRRSIQGALDDEKVVEALEKVAESLDGIPSRRRRVATASVTERIVLSLTHEKKGRSLVFEIETGADAKLLSRKPRQIQFVQGRVPSLKLVTVECDQDGIWRVVSHSGFYVTGRTATPRGGKGAGPGLDD